MKQKLSSVEILHKKIFFLKLSSFFLYSTRFHLSLEKTAWKSE